MISPSRYDARGACASRAAGVIIEVKMSYRFQNFLFSVLLAAGAAVPCPAQSKDSKDSKEQPAQSQPKEAEPPEEDESAKPKEYAFNPLQAQKEIEVGSEYFKKGAYKAAVARFTEATRWNPTLPEAYLKLGEAEEKLGDPKAAKEAYSKYLQLAPDAKNAAQIKKKLAKM